MKALVLAMLFIMLGVFCDVVRAGAPAVNANVTVYRCTDAKGKVTLQDVPCAKASKQEKREMLRPKDAPVSRKPVIPVALAAPEKPVQSFIEITPPPALYQCTNYEGKTRDSEVYDPNPRCEPLWALGYPVQHLPIEQRAACTWIKDSCVRYEGRALCERWREKRKQAQSDVRYAFSSTVAYKKSELARITQIVQQSCL
jgi:Domain of unknown function (DUF4124)